MTISSGDAQLLALLRVDARASTAALARQLGVSRTTVQSRIERLQQSGVIAGFTVRLGQQHERGQVRAHISITVLPKKMPAVVRALQAISPVHHHGGDPGDQVRALRAAPVQGRKLLPPLYRAAGVEEVRF